MSKKLALVALVAAVALGGAFWLNRGAAPDATSPLSGAAVAQQAPATEAVTDMALGQVDAPVTLVEYASFTCPHCATFHDRVFGQLKADYIDTGKVRFVYREVYFDKFGLWAAMVARCGGEMRYFGMVDMIYDTQRDWIGDGNDATVAENLRKIGLKAGLSREQVDACLNDGATAEAMVANFQKNATADGIDATPTLVIDGQKHSNMSYEELKAILDEKLAG